MNGGPKPLRVAQVAYAEYQTLSPVRRLGVMATLTPELREDKYKKLERKVAGLSAGIASEGCS